MKFEWLAIALSLSCVGTLTGINLVNSQETQDTKFVCGSWRNIPSTVAQTPGGNVLIVQWATDWVQNSSEDASLSPQSRCETVSDNFQQAYEAGTLQYITTGFKDDQNIICVAERYDGPCETQLFTLKPGSDPTESLNQLMRISNNDASRDSGPLMQSSGERIYVNFADFLSKAPKMEN